MTQYLISFDDGAMDFPEEEMPDVAAAVRVVRTDAKAAGVWVFSAGLLHQVPSVVGTDGVVTDGPYPETKEHLGGFAIVEVGRPDRRRVPLRAGGLRAPARPEGVSGHVT
jgi:hypothetical protein